MDDLKKVEWYEMRGDDGQNVLVMVSQTTDGASTAVPCEVSLVRSSLTASGGSVDEAVQNLGALLVHKTRLEFFGGTS